MSRVVASRNLIKSTPFRRFPFAGGCIGRSYCRWRCSVADKHSVETVKKLLEAAKPRKFKESVELAVNLRDVALSVPKNRVEEEAVLPYGAGTTFPVCLLASGAFALTAT